MLLRCCFPSFPPHCRISWGTCNFNFSFKGLNGSPSTRHCSVSNSWVTFLPLTQHSCSLKIVTMKQNIPLHPCRHFPLGVHLKGSPSLTAFLSPLPNTLYCLQHRNKLKSPLQQGREPLSKQAVEFITVRSTFISQVEDTGRRKGPKIKDPESTLVEITTTPLELLQIVVEHQSIIRTKQFVISWSILRFKTIPIFGVPAIQQWRCLRYYCILSMRVTAVSPAVATTFPADNYSESTVIPWSTYRTLGISWIFGGVYKDFCTTGNISGNWSC